jgi:alpha-D-glucose phosphate-specific phosphoglucomutase
MASSPIKFGTSGWRGLIADDFTFASVRLAVAAIAEHAKSRAAHPTLLVAHDTRFYSEEFTQLAVEVLQEHGIRVLRASTFAPTPAVAFEIMRRKLDGAINFTASHNPAAYHGLKFSSADAGPALPEVTRDIEARVARLLSSPPPKRSEKSAAPETISLAEHYLERLNQLVRFEIIRKSGMKFVVDPRHGCGIGYLDRALAAHGIPFETIHANRDVLFDGVGPDVSEEILAPLGKTVRETGATAGLATDGDADRFGIIDSDGAWISPNHILALLYDYICETRGWNLPAARSVATSHMIDAAAAARGQKTFQTPVGFKYIGQLLREDKIALGGEESAGLSIRGHIPEKDGILACLLVAEMTAARGSLLGEQIRAMFGKLGREFHPLRQNLHLSGEQKKRALEKIGADARMIAGRNVASVDRTDGAKFVFEDGSWMLCRLSGTEPLLRLYTEAGGAEAAARLARDAADWLLKN